MMLRKFCMFVPFAILLTLVAVPNNSADAQEGSSETKKTEELVKRFNKEQNHLWSDQDVATIFYEGEAEKVTAYFGGSPVKMNRVSGSNVWTATRKFQDLEKGIINFTIQIQLKGTNRSQLQKGTWRGKKAPKSIELADSLKGEISHYEVESKFLEQKKRSVTVYHPPVKAGKGKFPVIFMSDGSGVEEFAKAIEPLILKKKIHPIVLVGVHSGGYLGKLKSDFSNYNPADDMRASEYLPGIHKKRFLNHQKFFCNEIVDWAASKFPISTSKQDRGIMGVSNGGRFAATIGSGSQAKFGHVFAFSLGASPEKPKSFDPRKTCRFYLAAGTWEERFLANTQKFYDQLLKKRISTRFTIRTAGHDRTMWVEEFAKAVQHAFPSK